MEKTEEIINLIENELENKNSLYHEMIKISARFSDEGETDKSVEFYKYASDYLREYVVLANLLTKVEDLVKEGK